jgi:hypothetical protein
MIFLCVITKEKSPNIEKQVLIIMRKIHVEQAQIHPIIIEFITTGKSNLSKERNIRKLKDYRHQDETAKSFKLKQTKQQ